MKKILFNILLTAFLFFNIVAEASNLNVFSIGYFDFNKQKNEAVDIRFEKRLDKEIFDLGPEEEPLYYIKPFYGIEITTDSAVYGIGGIFIEEKISYKSNVEIHKYPEAEHAFARHGAESYSKEEADLALERSVSFLDIHLK